MAKDTQKVEETVKVEETAKVITVGEAVDGSVLPVDGKPGEVKVVGGASGAALTVVTN